MAVARSGIGPESMPTLTDAVDERAPMVKLPSIIANPPIGAIHVIQVISAILLILGYLGLAFMPVYAPDVEPDAVIVSTLTNIIVLLFGWLFGSSSGSAAKNNIIAAMDKDHVTTINTPSVTIDRRPESPLPKEPA